MPRRFVGCSMPWRADDPATGQRAGLAGHRPYRHAQGLFQPGVDRPGNAEARFVSEIAVERLKLEVARLRRERFGASLERSARIDQLELTLEDLEETLAETEAQAAAEPEARATTASSRRKPARRPLPEHLPCERIVHPGPTTCACCSGARLRPLGEDVTETLERIPARWVVIQHVRERFSCRDCETIAQAPAPFHPIPRGRAGPNLLAEVMMAKFGLHLPLHRQSQRFAHEGVPIDVSTLAGWVGAVITALSPLVARIEAHVRGAERLHLDDTPVPVLAQVNCLKLIKCSVYGRAGLDLLRRRVLHVA